MTEAVVHHHADSYAHSAPSVAEQLQSDPIIGLPQSSIAERLEQYGRNEMLEKGQKSPWRIVWEQLSNTLIVVLVVAAVISAVMGDVEDACAIGAIVLLNAALGFHQEYRAERAIAALRELAIPQVRVRRDGRSLAISATELVPGDIVLLEAGNRVPADGRLMEAVNLRVQEAALTGESAAVEKDASAQVERGTSLGDRVTMAFQGTNVAYGRGTMLVTATGMATELGQIASMIQGVKREPTPLQKRLNRLGHLLAMVALVIVVVIFLLGLPQAMKTGEVTLLFMTAVSLAVAAVPEGLPAVVTIALALGAQRMLQRRALIRKLPAVETLGSVTTICSDKTGTLTKNEMTVAVLDVAGKRLEFDEATPAEVESSPAISLLLAASELCCDAVLADETREHRPLKAIGDPTEVALVIAAARAGLEKSTLERALPRVAEVPFDSDRKRMTTVHATDGELENLPDDLRAVVDSCRQLPGCRLAFTKGAVDSLLQVTTHVWSVDHREPLDRAWDERIQEAHNHLAEQGMRVLAVGFRELDAQQTDYEQELTFIGLVGIVDPPRAEAHQAIVTCQQAGIRPVMITGDHPLTARYIAEQLGIDTSEGVVRGQDLDELNEQQLIDTAFTASIYARVSPEHKLRLVEALQSRGEVVSMTGDGVNDAPALKKANIGVAMGFAGTDVSKEASDMILQDDNFATIVAAVEQGRIIFDNVRKFIRYLLSANVGELWVMLLGPLLGMPLPLRPLQILWMNLVTDGFPALALGVEPAERDVMNRPPHSPQESVFARGIGVDIVWIGILMGLVSLAVGWIYYTAVEVPSSASGEGSLWQTMLFTTLTFSQMSLALAMRSDHDSFFRIGWLSNKAMLAAVTLTFALQMAVIYVPFLRSLFRTVPLGWKDLMIAIGLSTVVFWAVELKKLIIRRFSHPQTPAETQLRAGETNPVTARV